MTQKEKAVRFRELHRRPGVVLLANPWDAGSARILGGLGFEALATSSGAAAGAFGRRDGYLTRDEALESVRGIVNATELPVSGDLENGFGDSPEAAAKTVRLAAEIGLVGCSIEDAVGGKSPRLYDMQLASERVAAAVEAARSLAFPFTLLARAENFVRGKPDLDDAIKRLLAYQEAGADALSAPALPDLAAVRTVCSAVLKPVNFMVGARGRSFSVPQLAEAGIKRISFATSLYRAAMNGLIQAATEARKSGTFGFVDQIIITPDLNKFFPD